MILAEALTLSMLASMVFVSSISGRLERIGRQAMRPIPNPRRFLRPSMQ